MPPSPLMGSLGAAPTGLMRDSPAAVAAEREGKNAQQLLESVAQESGDDEIAVSVIHSAYARN